MEGALLLRTVRKEHQLLKLGQGLEFDLKYYIFHDFFYFYGAPFTEKSYDRHKDFYGLKLLAHFDVNLTSFLG